MNDQIGDRFGVQRRYLWMPDNTKPLEDGEHMTQGKLLWALAVIDAWRIARKTGIKPHVPSQDLFRFKRHRCV